MGQNLKLAGSQPQKAIRYAPIYVARFFQGLITQRSPLRDGGAPRIEEKFYGARGDALIAGSNVEISNRLTVQRRPGLLPNNTNGAFPSVNSFHSFRYFLGTGSSATEEIKTLVDTGNNIYDATAVFITGFSITSNVVTIFAANGYLPGQSVNITGFAIGTYLNNQVLTVLTTGLSGVQFTASFTHANVSFTADTGMAAAHTTLYTKAGEGAVYFAAAGNTLYYGTGANQKKYVISPLLWAAGTSYTIGQYVNDSNGYIQAVSTAGTTGGSVPVWNGSVGGTTTDNTVTWRNRGLAASQPWGEAAPANAPTVSASAQVAASNNIRFWSPNTAYLGHTITALSTPAAYSILDANGNIQVAQTGNSSLTSGTAYPTFGTKALAVTSDGAVTWTCYGPLTNWTPATALSPGQISIIDANGYLQLIKSVATDGKTGAVQPTWNNTIAGTTTDNNVTWYCAGPASILFTLGYQWGYAYKTFDGHLSTLSPLSPTTGPTIGSPGGFINGNLTVNCAYSTNAEVTEVWLFRTFNGGGTPFFLTAAANNVAGGTAAFTDTFFDSTLNEFEAAPLNGANNPPPTGLNIPVLHQSRIWGAIGATIYYSNAFNTLGNAQQSFPTSSYIGPFPAQVTRMVSTTLGLLVFTVSDVWVITGDGITTQFSTRKVIEQFGLLNYNALWTSIADIFFFSSNRQLVHLAPNAGVTEFGFNIGDQLELIDPNKAYVTYHDAGSQDNALYLGDGSLGWYRLLLSTVPDGAECWSPKATIVNGLSALQSVEVAPGLKKLLAGPAPLTTGSILMRDLKTFTDNGNTYAGGFTIPLTLAEPTQAAILLAISLDSVAVGSRPSLSYIADESLPYYTGAFISLSNYVNEPPHLPASVSRYRNRYFFHQTQQPRYCQDIQIQVNWPSEAFKNELLALTLTGALTTEF